MKTPIHFVIGESAAKVIQASDRSISCVIVEHDMLAMGEIQDYSSVSSWTSSRRRIHLETYGTFLGTSVARLVRRGRNTDVYLWAGAGLEEQLLICSAINIYKKEGIDIRYLNIVEFNGDVLPLARSVVEVDPSLMVKWSDAARSATQYEDVSGRIWSALTSNDPILVTRYYRESESKIISGVLRAVIYRFPCIDTGLNYWDKSILDAIFNGAETAYMAVIRVLAENPNNIDDVTFDWLLWRTRCLANPRFGEPLIVQSPSFSYSPAPDNDYPVSLSGLGFCVSNGESSALGRRSSEVIFGTRIVAGKQWVRDGDDLVLVSTS